MAPPFKEAEFDIMYGEGISRTGDLLDLGVEAGVIEKSGAWYSFDGERIGQGRENVKRFLKENPDICNSAMDKVKVAMGLVEPRAGETGKGSGEAPEASPAGL